MVLRLLLGLVHDRRPRQIRHRRRLHKQLSTPVPVLAPLDKTFPAREDNGCGGERPEDLLGMGSYLTNKLLVHRSVRILHRFRLRPCRRTTHGSVRCELNGGDRCVPLYVMLETEFACWQRVFAGCGVGGGGGGSFLGIPCLPRFSVGGNASITWRRQQPHALK
jgi:hypothetical protein